MTELSPAVRSVADGGYTDCGGPLLEKVGRSGIGREDSEHSLDFCSEPVNVCVRR